MDIELLFQPFNAHPFLVTLLLLTSMFFIAVWLRGWPTGSQEEDDDEDFLDNEEKNYTISFQQTKINLNSRGLPESIEGIVTIKKKGND